MMGKRTTAIVSLLLLVVFLWTLPGCASPRTDAPVDGPDEAVSLTIFGLAPGSGMQLRADAIAEAVRLEHPDWNVSSMAAGGEARLIEKRVSGEADLYYSSSFRALEVPVFASLHPGIDFEAATNYHIVLPSSVVYVQMFAMGSTGLETPADVVERQCPFKLGCGAGIMRALFASILEYYGATIEDTEAWGATYETMIASSTESVESLQSGRTDMGFTFGGLPAPALMGATVDLHYLPLSDPGLVEMLRQYGCRPDVIPAGLYPFVTSDVATVSTYESLVARPDVPEDVIYGVCEAIFEHLDLLVAAQSSSADLLTQEWIADAVGRADENGEVYHPGALKYLRDRGWID